MERRYNGSAWHDRFLPRLTSSEVQALPKEEALVVLPIGAVEQHGSHLPVYTDTLLAETVLDEACKCLPEQYAVWLLAPMPYGISSEHSGRAGTISLSIPTLQGVLMDIAQGVRESGFRRLLLFNGHGGNSALLNLMAREVRLKTGLMVFCLNVGGLTIEEGLITEKERLLGIHGGDYETSLIMASYPEWVREERLGAEYPRLEEHSRYLRFQNAGFAWTIDDVSESGILGDARTASADKGKLLYERQGRQVADILMELTSFEIGKLRQQ
ncbi:creatininase family protein [Paenibacillus doosanensis]|uniref:creatininase family protein n=1 Tax=Paenibacillus doosanensis TaxID=1229154 RepID=UPI00217F55E1|nr:creatininase family protein [Paenibacillus doosanensis]MCS7464002.1 creatininase family protein [Paenibacillus doosanensis]